jgi:hypothetical protein
MNALALPLTRCLTLDQIEVTPWGRPYDATTVSRLAQSIRDIGLQHPITVVTRDGRFALVAGRHRLEAFRVLGEERIRLDVTAAGVAELCRRGLLVPGYETHPQTVAHGILETAARYLGLRSPSASTLAKEIACFASAFSQRIDGNRQTKQAIADAKTSRRICTSHRLMT